MTIPHAIRAAAVLLVLLAYVVGSIIAYAATGDTFWLWLLGLSVVSLAGAAIIVREAG